VIKINGPLTLASTL